MTEEDIHETVVEPPQPGVSVLLSQARERLGLSQKEVADKLFLTTSFIRYIDDGEFERISKPAFLKGYLRSYARVVELSGDDMVARYEAEQQSVEPTPEIRGVTEEKVGTASITGPVLQTGVVGLIGLIALIAFIWWLASDSEEDTPRVTSVATSQQITVEDNALEVAKETLTTPVTESESVAEDSALPVMPADRQTDIQDGFADQSGMASSAVATDTDTDTGTTDIAGNTSAITEQTPQPTAQIVVDDDIDSSNTDAQNAEAAEAEPSIRVDRTTDGERSYITVDAGGFDQLELGFTEQCWVEVEDAEQGRIYNDLNREGDVLTLYGSAPFKLLLGKATAVEMIYNGRPFNLDPYIAPDRTAKLTVTE